MNQFKKLFWALALFSLCFTSCSDDDDEDPQPQPTPSTFTSLESPYLICANRNPGGVGFDFYYDGKAGGANNMESLTVNDFKADMVIRTMKGEKPDGSMAGLPFIQLFEGSKAINYSEVDFNCTGLTEFYTLSISDLPSLEYQSDDASFTLSGLQSGSTGKPLVSSLNQQYKKLIIGDKWKAAAINDIEGDEPIWIIQLADGKYAKMIVPDFPADPAPTATGYIDIQWALID